MSDGSNKYVIGLTGNIATGKSVVRKMLEHLGALGVDADGLTHRAMGKAGPAYQPIVTAFGNFILGEDGEIDRKRLGAIVFNDPAALRRLEAIVHPFVRQAVELLIGRAPQRVAVVEAIKLLEGGLSDRCDTIWVVDAPRRLQHARLLRKRGLDDTEADLRIDSQTPQSEKLARASVIINNAGAFEDTWEQVQRAWANLPLPASTETAPASRPTAGVSIRRSTAADATAIAEFINGVRGAESLLNRSDVIAAFGQKAYFMAADEGETLGVIGWQVENLVTRVDEVVLAESAVSNAIVQPLAEAVEKASSDLQSEAALVFIQPEQLMDVGAAFAALGYEQVETEEISIGAWRDAARESQPAGTTTLFKRLRTDRVLRPV